MSWHLIIFNELALDHIIQLDHSEKKHDSPMNYCKKCETLEKHRNHPLALGQKHALSINEVLKFLNTPT